MSVPASDAIASDIGHGKLGVRYGLRPFRDLLSETVGQRHLWVELRPKLVLETWASEGGGLYSKAVAETHDGVTLDVVGVQTLSETLTRVESTTLCTAGKFFYDGATLYIHLTADANPSGTTVVAELGVHVGSHGVYQPVLGPDRLANGTLEEWTGATPDGWSVAGAAGTLDKTTDDPLQGSLALRVTFAAETGEKFIYQDFTTLAAGAVYRYSGAYKVTGAGLSVEIFVYDTASEFLSADGRTIKGAGPVFQESASPDGEWRRFTFDFVNPSWATTRIRFDANATSATGTVDFDDLKLQLVPRYAYYEPLLSVQSLPTIEAARSDSFWGEMSSAIGRLSMLNGNGYWEALLASYDWVGADVVIRVGGRYQLGGNEVLMDDCPVIALAKLGAPSVTDGRVSFDLEDDRKLLQRTLPTRTYNNNGTDAYAQPDRGRVRALLFGQKDAIRPVQYDITTPYAGAPVTQGIYELVDCTDWPDGIQFFNFFDWYVDNQAARGRSTVLRNRVESVTNYSDGITRALTTGRFTMLRDQRPVIITQENNKLHFDIGGSQLTATLPVGTYTMYDDRNISGVVGLLKDMQGLMNTAASTSDIVCTFVDTAQKTRISKGAGTLNLLCATGSDTQNGIWEVLGFDAVADKTGSLTYDADEVFTFQAFDQTIRANATGLRDDSSGTYTGTPNASIVLAPDIVHSLLRVVLGQPAVTIDNASFVAARAVATRSCSLYIGAPRTVADVFQELETTGDMDIVLDGGVWYCLTRDTSVPAGTPTLEDDDYLAFEAGYEPEDLYGTVTLTYAQSPDNPEPTTWGGNFPWSPGRNTEMGEATDDTISLRYGRPHSRRFDTCLASAGDATTDPARLQEIAAEAQTKRRRFQFSTKGKALRVPVNGKIQLTRTRGLDGTGALDEVLVRVLSKRDDWARWVSDIVAIEVI